MENIANMSSSSNGYEVEFYNNHNQNLPGLNSGQTWKNNSSSDFDSSFAIDVSTSESELFIDELIELADESMSTASSSSVMSTPSPVVPIHKQQTSLVQSNLVRSAPPPIIQQPHHLQNQQQPPQPYYSRLHEALTQPRILLPQPQAPVRCHRCGEELTSRCLMQTCADDTRCKNCGRDLTAKCILAVCTVQSKTETEMQSQYQLPVGGRRPRVHHYSSPASTTTSSKST